MSKTLTTYSMWRRFRNCRKAHYWRHERQLVPLEINERFFIGSLVHSCLEDFAKHQQSDMGTAANDAYILGIKAKIDAAFANRDTDWSARRNWHMTLAMMEVYSMKYYDDPYEYVGIEQKFEGDIINPETGAASRTFSLGGKVDAIVRNKRTGLYYLKENKTASKIDDDYLNRLWCDFQIILYSHYVQKELGITLSGVVYDILGKTTLKQAKEETEEEYETRKAELQAKSKTGKPSTAKRKLGEPDDVFRERLLERYNNPLERMLERKVLVIDQVRFEQLQAELWENGQALLEARRRGMYYQNTSFCYMYRTECEYLELCRNNGDQGVIDNFFRVEAPNSELREDANVPF